MTKDIIVMEGGCVDT